MTKAKVDSMVQAVENNKLLSSPKEKETITLPLHNWEALHQLEKEKDYLSNISSGLGIAGIASGTFFNPAGLLLLALAYRPLIRLTKIVRISKVMHSLLQEFESFKIQIFPCLEVPGREPLDLFIKFPTKIFFIVSIRSMIHSKIVFNESNETLFVKRKGKGMKKWHPDPLTELSDYQAWLRKNRRELFGGSSNDTRRPLAKVLLLWHDTELATHKEHLYDTTADQKVLWIRKKGTTAVIREEQVIDFVKAYVAHSQDQQA